MKERPHLCIEWLWDCWHWLPAWGPMMEMNVATEEFDIACPGEWDFSWLGLHITRYKVNIS